MQRSRRITKKQKEYMVSFLETNPELLKISYPAIEKEMKWRELARGLNSPLLGSSKTTAQWKDTYKDVRSGIRRKYRLLRLHGNEGSYKLTSPEERFIKLWASQGSPLQYKDDEKNASDSNGTSEKIPLEDRLNASQNSILNCDDPLGVNGSSETILHKNNIGSSRNIHIRDGHINNEGDYNHRQSQNGKKLIFQEELKSRYRSSLSTQIENHSRQLGQLSQSIAGMADSITLLAQSNNNIAAAINNAVNTLARHFTNES